MKKISILLMLLCFTVGAKAQLLWKISGKGLTKPSYIMGTHHLAPLSITDSIADFRQALNETEQVYGEMVMEDMKNPANLQKMQQAILLPGDTTLHTLFSEARYDSLAKNIKELIGADLKMMDKIKPSFISTQISMIVALKSIKGFNPQQQLDGWIQEEAKKQGKKVAGLETMDFQIHTLFGTQSLQRQADQLFCTLIHLPHIEAQNRQLLAAYMQQDLEQLQAVFNEKIGNDCDALPEEEEALIYGRNAHWAEMMPVIMKEKPTLFAVGAGHLPGRRGVLNLLKQQGYTLEAIQ